MTTKFISLAAGPVTRLHDKIHKRLPHPKVAGKYALCTLIGLGGAYCASIHQEVVPHFVQDFVAYSIHGLGVAPIVESVLAVCARIGSSSV